MPQRSAAPWRGHNGSRGLTAPSGTAQHSKEQQRTEQNRTERPGPARPPRSGPSTRPRLEAQRRPARPLADPRAPRPEPAAPAAPGNANGNADADADGAQRTLTALRLTALTARRSPPHRSPAPPGCRPSAGSGPGPAPRMRAPPERRSHRFPLCSAPPGPERGCAAAIGCGRLLPAPRAARAARGRAGTAVRGRRAPGPAPPVCGPCDRR